MLYSTWSTVSTFLIIGQVIHASPFPQSAIEITSLRNVSSSFMPAENFVFEQLVRSGLQTVESILGTNPAIVFIGAQPNTWLPPEDPADFRSITIGLDGPKSGEKTILSNKASVNPEEWWPPHTSIYPTDPSGQPVKPPFFRWIDLQMTLKEAIQVAREAGYPPPWRKMTIAFPNFKIFDEPGEEEIVYDLVKFRDKSERVAVGSRTRRVKHQRRQPSLVDTNFRNVTTVEVQ